MRGRSRRAGDSRKRGAVDRNVVRRKTYMPPRSQLSRSERRERRRLERQLERHYRTESPTVARIKQVAVALIISGGIAIFVYALFIYR